MSGQVYSVDNNILKTIRALGSVKPDGIIISVSPISGLSIDSSRLKTNSNGFLLVFTFDTKEQFGIEYPTMQEALRQLEYFNRLLEAGSGKFRLSL